MNSLNLFLEFLTLIALISALATITSTNPVIAIVFLIVLFLNVGIYLILMGLQFIGLSYLLVYVGAITVLFLFIVMMLSVDVVSSVEVGPNYSKLLPLAYSIAILFIILFLTIIPSFFVDFASSTWGKEIYFAVNSLIFNFTGSVDTANYPNYLHELYNWNPNSPIFSPLYSYWDFGVFHYIDRYNAYTEDISLINVSAFGDPSTLLHKNLQIQTLGESIYGNYSILLIFSSFLLLLAMVCPIVLARNSKISTT